MEEVVDANGESRVPDHDHDDGCGSHAGDQGADACTGSPHAKAIDQNGIDQNVDDIDDKGVDHRHLAVSHRPEQSGTDVYKRQGQGRSARLAGTG